MRFPPRPWRRAVSLPCVLAIVLLCLPAAIPAFAAEKLHFHADEYQIDAALNPHEHKIAARAKVKITALDDLNIATFQLHNDLRLTKVTDATGKPLNAERMPQDSSAGVALKSTLPKEQSTALTFEYEVGLGPRGHLPVPELQV